MNSTSERMLTELLVARAFFKLSSIPAENSAAVVSLASVGNCEIRMLRGSQTDPETTALFWLELFDHGAGRSIDSFRCDKIEDAAPIFEYMMFQATGLNSPDPDGAEAPFGEEMVPDPMAAATDWLDAYRAATLSIVDFYASDATLECDCDGKIELRGREAIAAYWRQRFNENPAGELTDLQRDGNDVVVNYRVPDGIVQAILMFDAGGMIERSRCSPLDG